MKRFFILSLISALCIVSCAKSSDISGSVNDRSSFAEQVMDITAYVDDFISADQTKSSFDPTTRKWTWTKEDQLGFWSDPKKDNKYGEPTQVVFDVTSVGDNNNATFHGNGFGILRECTYHTYYPYDPTADSTQVSISYLGQNPKSNGGYDHLGKFDYLYSDEYTVPASGDISFQYRHKGCIARFTITVNTTATVGNITKFTLSTDDSNTLVSQAVYNPLSPVGFTSRTTVSSIDYPLGDIENDKYQGVELTNNQLVVYTMMSPAAMEGKKFTATLTDADGNIYQGSSSKALSKDQDAGKIYGYSIAVSNPSEIKDLSNPQCANCYIVSAPGNYKFRANKGVSETALSYIRTTDPVAIYWASYGTGTAPESLETIISDVEYDSGTNYIRFTVPDNDNKGNALIVIRDINNNVAWSWHIWRVQGITDEEYLNGAGSLMDRNLGALATTGNLSNGLLYQWGRKDPFLGHTEIAGNTPVACIGNSTNFWTRDKNTYSNDVMINYAIYHPTVFVCSNTLDWLCYGQSGDSGLWHNSDGSKTDYDPCPPGYKVPDGTRGTTAKSSNFSDWGFYAKAVNNNRNLASYYTTTQIADGFNFTVDNTSYQVVRGNQYMSIPLKNGGTAKYPYSGYISETGVRTVGWVQIWSDFHYSEDTVSWSNTHPACLNVNMGSHEFFVNWNGGRAGGKAVRCQKMNNNSKVSSQANENLTPAPSPSAW